MIKESNFLEYLQRFDWFPKENEEVKVKSAISGAISIICISIVSVLFLSELFSYIYPDISNEIRVDSMLNNKIIVEFSITFPSLSCDAFGIDVMDSSGALQLEISADIEKKRLFPGCHTKAKLALNKVKGEFHVGFGRNTEAHGEAHTHRFAMHELLTFNCSHIIESFSVGPYFPGVVNPLDGMTKIVPKGLGRFQYFLNIVPTVYKNAWGNSIYSGQYSFTEMNSYVDPLDGNFKQPGVFFRYDISPYSVHYKEDRISFPHFITALCAVVGGVWAVFGLLTSSIWFFEKLITGKTVS